jgi:putative ABC transport system permease protein
MKALDRKLLRDLRLMWSQALTIALVVASGIGGFITTLSAVDSLALARDSFYAKGPVCRCVRQRQARARWRWPRRCWLPGVADVQTTVEHVVRISMPGQRPHHRPADRGGLAAPRA